MPTIISTLTDSVDYARHADAQAGGAREVVHSVSIKGGANLAQKNLVLLGEGPSSKGGIKTEVNDEQLEFLKAHPLFQTHVANGFITVVAGKAHAEKVAKDMAKDDDSGKGGSAQLTEADTKAGGRLAGHKLKGAKE